MLTRRFETSHRGRPILSIFPFLFFFFKQEKKSRVTSMSETSWCCKSRFGVLAKISYFLGSLILKIALVFFNCSFFVPKIEESKRTAFKAFERKNCATVKVIKELCDLFRYSWPKMCFVSTLILCWWVTKFQVPVCDLGAPTVADGTSHWLFTLANVSIDWPIWTSGEGNKKLYKQGRTS